MDIPKRLIECLTKNNVRYEILHHTEAFSAQRIAEAEHVKAEHHAKVVMVRSGEQHFMVVVPANRRVDLEKVEQMTGHRRFAGYGAGIQIIFSRLPSRNDAPVWQPVRFANVCG